MLQVLQSSEFWAAVAGGLLALLGSYLSLRWQSNNAKSERRDLYLAFYSDSFRYVLEEIREIEKIWENNNFASHHHLNQIERVVNAIDRHMDGFALIEEHDFRDKMRRFFFDLMDDVNFLRFCEKKKEDAKLKYNQQEDKDSADARAGQAEFLESNNLITKRISMMKSKAVDMQSLIGAR